MGKQGPKPHLDARDPTVDAVSTDLELPNGERKYASVGREVIASERERERGLMSLIKASGTATFADVVSDVDRAAKIAAISERLRNEDIRHIYCQYVSIQGRVLAKAIPASLWENVAAKGLSFAYASAAGWYTSRTNALIGEGGGKAPEGIAVPDLDTFEVLPWDPTMARVFVDHFRRPDEQEAGQPVGDSSRQVLARALADLRDSLGLEAQSGCEPEMSWFKDRESINTSASRMPDYICPGYHVRHLEDVRPVLKKVTEYGQAMGLEMIQADYEDPGQLECNFLYDECMKTADRLVTYRQICVQVAEELGLFATFMPKPVAGIMANGCHHHISLWRDGENVLLEPDAYGDLLQLTETGRHAIGGILEHSRGMMALLAPTVNSYKRFLEGIWAPVASNWGFDNRSCTVRVLPGRFEIRSPDASVNPYLSHTALLAAMRDGIERRIDPGPAETGDTYMQAPASSTNGKPKFAKLPVTLAQALESLAGDEVIRNALPESLYDTFVALKTDEWERYCGAITNWDYETYLDYVP